MGDGSGLNGDEQMELGDTGHLLEHEHTRVLVDNDRVAAVRRKLDARGHVCKVLPQVKDDI